MNSKKRHEANFWLNTAVLTALAVCLTACGGGGNGGSGFVGASEGAQTAKEPSADEASGGSRPTVQPSPVQPAPTAVISGKSSEVIGKVLKLSGSSSKGDGPLAYSWLLQSKPTMSESLLSGASSDQASLLLDAAGDYVFRLVTTENLKDSKPAYKTVTATIPEIVGPLLKFSIQEIGDYVPSYDRSLSFRTASYLWPEESLDALWNFLVAPANIFPPTPSDESGGRRLGSTTTTFYTARPLYGSVSRQQLTLGVTNAFLKREASIALDFGLNYGYEFVVNPILLAKTPLTKAVGDYFEANVSAGSAYRGNPPTVKYKIALAKNINMLPPGWDARVESLIQITGISYQGGQYKSSNTVYSKKITDDFDEVVSFKVDLDSYPELIGDQVVFDLGVSHRIVYQRKP